MLHHLFLTPAWCELWAVQLAAPIRPLFNLLRAVQALDFSGEMHCHNALLIHANGRLRGTHHHTGYTHYSYSIEFAFAVYFLQYEFSR